MSQQDTMPEMQSSPLRRFLPLAVIIIGAVILYFLVGDYLSFSALEENHEALTAWRDDNYVVAALVFIAIYAAATAFSLPGGLALTLTGGFLFGTILGGTFAVTGATIGAVAVFLAVKTGIGSSLGDKVGKFAKKAEDGFRENQISFLLIMRLVPAIPFFAANIVPAVLGARTFTYSWTTFVGIMPGAFVYASVGAGLGAVFAAGEKPDLGIIFEPQVLIPLLGLSALAALPVVIKKLRGK